eukprot:augustus_masked-scaffold_3-processed-gene-6.55-mRNA-1 protein AED:0.38 eAED:0.42 QI:0/-1/0/1/-1/1/1/0/328
MEVIPKEANVLVKSTETKKLAKNTLCLTGHSGTATSTKFSPTGDLLATAGSDKKLLLWDIFSTSCENILEIRVGKNSIQDVCWSPNSKLIFGASADASLHAFNVETGSKLQKYVDHTSFINSLDIAPSPKELLVSGSDDKTAKLWDIREKRSVRSFDHDFQVLCVKFHPIGQTDYIVTGSLDGNIYIWDARRPLDPLHILQGHSDMITGLSLLPENHLASYSMKGELFFWNINPFVAEERLVAKNKLNSGGQFREKNLLKLNISPSKNYLGFGSVDGSLLHIFDVKKGELIANLNGHEGSIFEVSFHPKQENIVASASADSTVVLGYI